MHPWILSRYLTFEWLSHLFATWAGPECSSPTSDPPSSIGGGKTSIDDVDRSADQVQVAVVTVVAYSVNTRWTPFRSRVLWPASCSWCSWAAWPSPLCSTTASTGGWRGSRLSWRTSTTLRTRGLNLVSPQAKGAKEQMESEKISTGGKMYWGKSSVVGGTVVRINGACNGQKTTFIAPFKSHVSRQEVKYWSS